MSVHYFSLFIHLFPVLHFPPFHVSTTRFRIPSYDKLPSILQKTASIQLRRMSSDFPYAIEPLEEKENDAIKKDFTGYLSGAVRVQPRGYFFQGIYRHYAHQYFNLPLKPTDVFVASYPKSGGTQIRLFLCILVKNRLTFINNVVA